MRHFARLDWIRDAIESVTREVSVVAERIALMRIEFKAGGQDRISEAALVVVLDVDDRLFIFEVRRQLLIRRPSERRELRDLEHRVVDAGEDESGRLATEVGVRVLDFDVELGDHVVDLKLV